MPKDAAHVEKLLTDTFLASTNGGSDAGSSRLQLSRIDALHLRRRSTIPESHVVEQSPQNDQSFHLGQSGRVLQGPLSQTSSSGQSSGKSPKQRLVLLRNPPIPQVKEHGPQEPHTLQLGHAPKLQCLSSERGSIKEQGKSPKH